jgi:cyclomaltodextrinase / maltogenic alpha-amylase / neopullulanase
MPGNPDQAIWWSVYPLGFTAAPTTPPPATPTRHRLRHLEPWLDHITRLGCTGLMLGPIFTSETHGYDTVDHLTIDPRLGDDTDFDALIHQTRHHGLDLILDGVFNHVGRSFTGNPDWIRTRPGTTDPDTFEGHHRLITLDHDRRDVQHYVTTVLTHWLDRGATGWRLDAAYAIPAPFWNAVLPPVRARHPDAWFVGEMIHGDYTAYTTESGLDSVTQYELWKALWSSLNDRNLYELAHALGRHNTMLDTFTPLTFVGNHDVTRIATRLDDPRHLGHALAVLFTVGGVPAVYYGDELALQGTKEEREGGDDAIRPPFPATPPTQLPEHARTTFELHRRLIRLRRRHPWLARAHTTVHHLTNHTAALRTRHGDDTITTLLNLGDHPHRFPADTAHATLAETATPGHDGDPALVPAHGWHIFTGTAR